MLFAPELLMLIGSLVLFCLCLGQGKGNLAKHASLVLAIAACFLSLATLQMKGSLFYDAYRIDMFSQLFKLAISIGLVAVLLFSGELKGVNDRLRPEYFLFMILSTLGLMMLVSSVELLSLFIALELSSYSLYLMVPMRDDHGGMKMQMEAAIKYILFGVVATGTMLYGMSFIFGMTGTTYFSELVPKMHGLVATPTALLAIALLMSGFFYKLAVFPFHFWVPDVYEGAPTPVTASACSVFPVFPMQDLFCLACLP